MFFIGIPVRGEDRHGVPNPKEFPHEIAEEARSLRQEISEGIIRIYSLDPVHNNSLKNLSYTLHDLLEKKLWLKIS